jgi:hypothetical protein
MVLSDLWRENQRMQPNAIAHANHLFAPIERDIIFNLGLVAGFPGCD